MYPSLDLSLVLTSLGLAQELLRPCDIPPHVLAVLPKATPTLATLPVLRFLVDASLLAPDCCRRITVNYTVANLLNMSYQGMINNDAMKVLKFLVLRGQAYFELAASFIALNKFNLSDVSLVLATLFLQQILLTPTVSVDPTRDRTASVPRIGRAILQDENWATWSDAEFTDFANLCGDPSLLGRRFLSMVTGDVSVIEGSDGQVGKLSIATEVTLLCRAHQCYIMTCSMDGIDAVLKASQKQIPYYVQQGAYPALVQLLVGVKKFRDMEMIFDVLLEHDLFELVLSKGVLLNDPHGQLELKIALRDYLLRRRPNDIEKLQMVSLHFRIFREIGENRMAAALKQIRRLGKHAPGFDKIADLLYIIQMLSEAATNLVEECPHRAAHCLSLARLVGLQTQLLDLPLLNLHVSQVPLLLLRHPNFKESLIIALAYGRAGLGEWVSPVFQQVGFLFF